MGAVPYESTPSSSRRDRDRDFLDGERGAISKVSPDLGNGARSAVLPDASLVPPRTFAQTRTCQQSDSPEIFSHRLPTVSLEGPSHLATREDHPKPGITRLRQLNISLEASRGSVKSARSYP